MITKLSEAGVRMIKNFEQLRLEPYKDEAGVPTIGWGTTVYPDGNRVRMTDPPITKEYADACFRHDAIFFEKRVEAFTRDDISQRQFDALVSLCYNIGDGALKSSTVLKRVNANPDDPTIREAINRFRLAGGKVSAGLVKRRKLEADYYFGV